MNDRPSVDELLDAVADFLDLDVVPALSGKLQYNARVAAHVVRIVRRELESEERQLAEEWRRLNALEERELPIPEKRDTLRARIGERSQALVERIRAGEADTGPWRDALIAHLRQCVADKLEVSRGRS